MENKLQLTAPGHRYRQLDSLRGLAALFVLLNHYAGFLPHSLVFDAIKASPLGILFNGGAAVMFFFVLSGFVLSLPFVDGKKPLILTAFYTKRFFRIYPAFIFAIILTLFLKQFVFDKTGMTHFSSWVNIWNWDWTRANIKEILRTLLLIGPDFKLDFIDPPIWSLVIEMKMSIILPFFIMIVSRNSLSLNILLLFMIVYLTYDHTAWAISVFYMGILMAKYKDELFVLIKSWRTITLLSIIACCIFLYNNNLEFLKTIQQIQSPFKYIWSKYLMATGSSIIIMTVLAREKLSRFFNNRIFTFLGDISYSFYLIHAPLLLTMASLFSNRFSFSIVYILIATLVLAIILSYLMVMFIERPFQKLGIRIMKKYDFLNMIKL